MPTPKIVTMTTSCRACEKRQGDTCSLVDTMIVDKDIVAPFCPLPDHPAQVIASQQYTIMGLREPHKWGFNFALMNHVGAKLKLNITAGLVPSITIPCKQGGEELDVCFRLDHITAIDVPALAIVFMDRGRTYKLYVDTSPPKMSYQSDVNPALWGELEINI